MRLQWETARYISLNIMATQVKQGSIAKIRGQMRFPWEKTSATEFKGDANQVLEKWDKIPFQNKE